MMRWLFLILVAVVACGPSPESTGTVCPDPDPMTLTYDNFGKSFMDKYCTWCHASDLPRSKRNGAPLYHDFDTFDGIIVVADHVDEYAAAGPDATNTLMPPDGTAPSEEERLQLGEWLACELDQI